MENNEKTQYVISFLLNQRGEYTDWIEQVLLSGLRDGETLQSLCISEIIIK